MTEARTFVEFYIDRGRGILDAERREVDSADPRKVRNIPNGCVRFTFVEATVLGGQRYLQKWWYPKGLLVMAADLEGRARLDEEEQRILSYIRRTGRAGAIVGSDGAIYPYTEGRDHAL